MRLAAGCHRARAPRRALGLAGLLTFVVGIGGGAFAAAAESAPVEARAAASSALVADVPLALDRAARSRPTSLPNEATAPEVPSMPAPPAPAPPPPPAPAAPAPAACERSPQARGERVLATLPGVWRSTGMPVQFSAGRQGMFGEVRTDQWVVHVYVRSCRAQSDAHLRHVVAHELGHAHEVAFLTDEDRVEYQRARGLDPGIPWYGCSGCADLSTPAGDYAEVYGQWLRGASTNQSKIGTDASAQAVADLAARFFSIGS